MNILNVNKEEVKKKIKEYHGDKDIFKLFFKIGKQYMKKYETKKANLHTKAGQEEIRKILFALVEELMEFANTLKNKSWTKVDYPVDEEHAMEEICDAFAFWIQLLLMLDFDAERFKDLYIKKQIVNEFRLRSNY